eukprot:scaffold470_cov135-Isochrysis_galbana.AAC.3
MRKLAASEEAAVLNGKSRCIDGGCCDSRGIFTALTSQVASQPRPKPGPGASEGAYSLQQHLVISYLWCSAIVSSILTGTQHLAWRLACLLHTRRPAAPHPRRIRMRSRVRRPPGCRRRELRWPACLSRTPHVWTPGGFGGQRTGHRGRAAGATRRWHLFPRATARALRLDERRVRAGRGRERPVEVEQEEAGHGEGADRRGWREETEDESFLLRRPLLFVSASSPLCSGVQSFVFRRPPFLFRRPVLCVPASSPFCFGVQSFVFHRPPFLFRRPVLCVPSSTLFVSASSPLCSIVHPFCFGVQSFVFRRPLLFVSASSPLCSGVHSLLFRRPVLCVRASTPFCSGVRRTVEKTRRRGNKRKAWCKYKQGSWIDPLQRCPVKIEAGRTFGAITGFSGCVLSGVHMWPPVGR